MFLNEIKTLKKEEKWNGNDAIKSEQVQCTPSGFSEFCLFLVDTFKIKVKKLFVGF
jgi:hypothetical protein